VEGNPFAPGAALIAARVADMLVACVSLPLGLFVVAAAMGWVEKRSDSAERSVADRRTDRLGATRKSQGFTSQRLAPLPTSNDMPSNQIRIPLTIMPTAGHYDLYSPAGCRFSLQPICQSADQLPYAPHGWFWALTDEPIEEGEED
jgi:hypothetical protein